MTSLRFVNGGVLLPDAVRPGVEIALDGERIAALCSLDRPTAADAVDLAHGWLVPGFVDTQVNGGGGVLFNDETSVEGIVAIGAAHARYGTTAFLPTLISDSIEKVALALEVTDRAIVAGVPGVVGVHIEGPFLNATRKGIHDVDRFRLLDSGMLALLTRPRRGQVLLTLAPELADPADIAALVAAGVRVSAGHSEATYEEAIAAFDAGLSGVTHLFNAMPPMLQRKPGLAGAALDDPRPWCGLIVDGVHVAPAVLRIALRARPRDRMMLVTDAMPPVGTDAGSFVLQGRTINRAGGICSYADGTLAGSDLDMGRAVANSVNLVGIDLTDAVAMAAANPAAFLGLGHERGVLAAGMRADWVQLDAKLAPVATWIGGRRVLSATR